MKFLYSPWRKKYVEQVHEAKKESTQSQDCVFCQHMRDVNDEKNLILKRVKDNFIMLNLYPYNAGHLMIVPNEHQPQLSLLSQEARRELMELANESSNILQTVLKAGGINIGMNIGKSGGAGIPSHIHLHVIPRWEGDTNFMPLIAETLVCDVNLNELYQELKPAFNGL